MTEELKQQEQNTENINDLSEKSSDELNETQEETADSAQKKSDVKNELSEENSPSTSDETTDSSSQESPEITIEVSDDEPNSSELQEVIAILQQDNASLKKQLDEQIKQTESFKGQYVRLAADFENFRKRTSKEKEDLENKVKRNTITELLGAIDSF